MDKATKKRFDALLREKIDVVPYDPTWPQRYTELEGRLKRLMPRRLVQRIAHIGSTAVPGLSAKPIIDVQVEVNDMEEVQNDMVPLLVEEGYEYFWRPSIGEDAPYYAWFIKRDANGVRNEHVHVVSPDKASVDRIVFRDHLCRHPETAAAYEALKTELARKFPKDRVAYTQGKTTFIQEALKEARTEKIRR